MAKVRNRNDREITVVIRLLAWAVVAWGITVIGMHLGNARSTPRQHVPADPITLVRQLDRGQLRWPPEATTVVIGEIVLLATVLLIVTGWRRRRARSRASVDAKAPFMARGAALRPLTAAGVAERADTLRVRIPAPAFLSIPPGIPIGTAVAGGVGLFGSYEDLHLDIWGPRQGKTSCRVIPAIMHAIGPVLVTASTREVLNATRDAREAKGSRVWVFDPQAIAQESPRWYWDPIAWVDRDAARAARLAGHFADAVVVAEQPRRFIEAEAEDLLAGLFLAASHAQAPITVVWEWVTTIANPEPVELLRRGGSHFAASGLAVIYNADPDLRGYVFGQAKRMIRCLQFPDLHPWVMGGGGRVEFDAGDFLLSNDTLYSLSVAGRTSAAPVVSALLEAVLDAATRSASYSPGERLPTPLLAVIDDAANVVSWKDFPQRYSDYGARGIILMTMLQSWAQGVRCWGHGGMSELWSAATIKVIGGGVDDVPFLRERVDGIGGHEVQTRSMSLSTKGFGYSTAISSENTLGVAELRSLPRGRAVLFAAGVAPVLIRTVPWWEGEHAEAIARALAERTSGPTARTTVEDLLAQVRTSFGPARESDPPSEVRPL